MAIIIKKLGANTITTTLTSDLYTVPAARSAVVNNVRLVNGTTGVTDAMNLYAKPSGQTARRIYKKDFTLAAGAMLVLEDVMTLAQGDKIQISIPGPSSPSLAYMVNGAEQA